MGFQAAPVNVYNTIGIPGEIAFDGPQRAGPANIVASGNPNVIGYAYTLNAGGDPNPGASSPAPSSVRVGGTGLFAGILVNPKSYTTSGTTSGALMPSLALPDNSIGEFLGMGEIFVALPAAAAIGDSVYYDNTTGALGSVTNFVGTGSITTTVLTITATTAGALGIGSVVTGPNVLPGTIITSLGTGTGGNGTYNLNQTQTAASGAIAAGAIAPTGKTLVPNAKVTRYTITAAGVAVIKLTN